MEQMRLGRDGGDQSGQEDAGRREQSLEKNVTPSYCSVCDSTVIGVSPWGLLFIFHAV